MAAAAAVTAAPALAATRRAWARRRRGRIVAAAAAALLQVPGVQKHGEALPTSFTSGLFLHFMAVGVSDLKEKITMEDEKQKCLCFFKKPQ